MPKVKALVTGCGSGVGQSIIKSLRLSKFNVQVIGTEVDPFNCGVFACDKGYLVPQAEDKYYKENLMDIIKLEKPDIIFPGTDTELYKLAELKEELENLGCFVIVGSMEAIKIARNKLFCAKFFKDNGLPFVNTVHITDLNSIISESGFPLIIKPIDGSGSSFVKVILNSSETEHISSLSGANYIVQEFLIPKSWNKAKENITSEYLYKTGFLKQNDEISIQIFITKEGKIPGCFISVNDLKAGFPVKIRILRDDYLENMSLTIGKLLYAQGLIGPCNIQCKITQDGPIIFEINARYTGITGMRAAMGFNECEAAIRNFIIGDEYENICDCLKFNDKLASVRYMTEMIINTEEINNFHKKNKTAAKGMYLTL